MRKLRAGASPENTPGSPGPRWFRLLPGAARIVAAARSQTAKTLNFPGELLSGIRWALLVFSLCSAGALLVVLAVAAASDPLRVIAILGIAAIMVKWIVTFRSRSLVASWDVLDVLALILAAIVTTSPMTVLMVLYVRVCYRSMESSRARTIAVVAIYSVGLLAAVGTNTPLGTVAPFVFLLTGFPLCALIMHTLSRSLRRLDESLLRERQLRTELQQENSESFRLLFMNNPHPMWIYDIETLAFLQVNVAATERYGYSQDEFLTMTIKDIRPPDEVGALLSDVRRQRPQHQHAGSWRHVLRDGRELAVEITSSLMQFAGHDAALVLAQDVTERKELDEQLRRQAFHDPLTGLANRALFRDRLEHTLGQRTRSQSVSAVLFVDLDRFKTVNDSLGHGAGDGLLVQVAERLVKCVRPGDTVSRFGGDEFAILLDQVSDLGAGTHVADRIMAELHSPFVLGEEEWFVSASVGIALTTETDCAPDEMLRSADTAMYAAKALGRGHYVVYEASMHEAVLTRRVLETELRNAIAQGELTVAYQPEVDIRSGRIVGMEALARWHHPTRGPLSPDVFIPLAEELGLIDDLDDLVLRTVTAQGRRWQRKGLSPVRLAVNVSAKELNDGSLFERVSRALSRSGLEPSWLELEVTESAAANSPSAVEVLGRLAKLGVQIAIDDFGVGYSMLSRLQNFPLTKLKIDRAFINEVTDRTDRGALVRGIIAMGHSLALEVVAEGVETIEQLKFLEEHGCDQVQGFLISRPVEAAAAERLLKNPVLLDPRPEHRPLLAAAADG